MAELASENQDTAAAGESFAALLDESLGQVARLEGSVLRGQVVAIEGDLAVIDVGLKSEGRVPLKEFSEQGRAPEVKVGDSVEVYLERMENKNGEAMISRDKARREESWTQLEKSFGDNERVTGVIFGRVKGGFTVDLSGAVAFLPGSQVDIRPVRDVGPLMGTPQPFQILKMDRARGNIVVSRRAVLEETRAEQRSELISGLSEGQVLDGVVKNITDYGAFVDLGGVDGLLHVTDISWKRIGHPAEALTIGQQVKVQVIRFNAETQRISLGMKQLEADPWEGVAAKYPVGTKFTGRVTNITDYGAFVELEPGIEGLVHVSEMSWTKKNIHPGKIVSTSQEVEVMVLDVDEQKRRISLGLKQCGTNPWESFLENTPVGSELEGEIKNITEFGLFVGLPGDIDGMAHLSDLFLGHLRRGCDPKLQQGRCHPRQGLGHRHGQGTHQLRDKATHGRSFLSFDGFRAQGRCGYLHRSCDHGQRHRSRTFGRCHRLHSQVRSLARTQRAASGPLRRRRKNRCQGDRHRFQEPQDLSFHQAA